MKVSIIATTFNRSLQMKRGLSSILNQDDLPKDLELILINDGSSDETDSIVSNFIAPLAKDKRVDFKYIHLNYSEHRISCIPKNIGIKHADGEIIIFSESENLHVNNTIKQLIDKIQEHPNQTPIVTQYWSMGKRIWEKLSEDNFLYPARILSHPYAMLVNGNMQNTKAPDADFAITGSLNCFTGALFLAKKEWIEAIGGFDESMTGHGWEDWDILHRLNKYGKGVLYCNDIIAIHQWHEKNYPYNTDTTAKANGKMSEQREGYQANIGKEWGKLD